MGSLSPGQDTADIMPLDTAHVTAAPPSHADTLLAIARGTTPDAASLAALEHEAQHSPTLASLLRSCLDAASLGGKGDELARELACAYSPLAVADLVRRARETHGRDADRLWGRVLAAAGLDRPDGAVSGPGSPITVTGSQVAILVQGLSPEQLQALVAGRRARLEAGDGRPGVGGGGPVSREQAA